MQRIPSRVRPDRWQKLDTPGLKFSAVVMIGFHVAMYGYALWSCRPGGHLWETISGYEGGGMINMTGTGLGIPFRALEPPYKHLDDSTCGGTVNGNRPVPGWDTLVCTPTMDIRSEDTYATWKRNLASLGAMMVAFLLLGYCFKSGQNRERVHVICGILVIFVSFGILGTALVAIMTLIIVAVCRIPAEKLTPNKTVAVIWFLAIAFMELVSRFLGEQAHKVPGWSEDQGTKSWSLTEELMCGKATMYENKSNSAVCWISNPFLISGLAPWFVFRFIALKLISLGVDTLWNDNDEGYKFSKGALPLEEKTKQHLRHRYPEVGSTFYSWKYYIAYLGYPPLFFAGPILGFNAFVAQLREPVDVSTYNEGKPPVESGQSTGAVMRYVVRVLFLMVFIEFFSVYWWYYQKLNMITCTEKDPYDRCLMDDLSPWELYVGMHVVLHYTWLTLMVIWRFGRAAALIDGIDSCENMNGCVSFNYSFKEFWRIWHSSMNEFMIRYLFKPLLGKDAGMAWVAATTLLVFLFVGYWHERTGFFTQPAWFVWAALNALGVTVNTMIEKMLGPRSGGATSDGDQNGSNDSSRLKVRQILIFLGKGAVPILLISANVPAIFLSMSDSMRFYHHLFLRGWRSLALVVTLVITFACNAHVVDTLRDETARPPDSPRELQPGEGRAPLNP